MKVAASALTVFFLATSAWGQDQCEIPREGKWQADFGQTIVVGGRGGGPEQGIFDIEVEGCGDVLVTSGLGSNEGGLVKTFYRAGENYEWSIVYQGFPITIVLKPLDDANMTAEWLVGGRLAFAPGVLQHHAAAPPTNIDPRCGCEPFVQALRDAIWSNDYFIAAYRNLAKRPSNLDSTLPWQADVSEALLDLQYNLDVSLGEAVEILNGMPGGRLRARDGKLEAEIERRLASRAAEGGDGESGSGSGATAHTKPKNCEIVWETRATGCASDLLNEATAVHENVHRQACLAQNKLYDDWNFMEGEDRQPTYKVLTDKPANLSAEEIQAYSASSDFIRTRYAQLCGKPLD